ncbi:MAG: efflux RND transporter periplasmic adaptor subunit [Acidobacteriota bacterium]
MSPGRPSLFRRLRGRLAGSGEGRAAEREALRLPPPTRGTKIFAMAFFFLLGSAIAWFAVADPLDLRGAPGPAAGPALVVEPAETLYQCPMHPEVIESKPGKCPICGMVLVPMAEVSAKAPPTAPGERRILYWYAPMDPTYVRDEPGLSPMGMKLVPKYADEEDEAATGVIRIDPVQVQNMGVVSTPAVHADLARYSRTVGILDFDADNVTWINTKFEGWVEVVHVTYVGEHVAPGEPLFEIYSPELVTTQEEYLRALDYLDSVQRQGRAETLRQAESLVRSTRERLEYWDITEEQIARLEASREVKRRLTVTSPTNGVVAQVMSEALEGMYVKPGMNLYQIVDLSSVWVHADIYELDIPWIREGQPAVVSFRSAPQERFRGEVLFLYPEVSRETRTMKICVEVPNPGRRLRPGMYADVTVEGDPVRNAVVIPESAVIHSGERDLVFLDLGEGRYAPRDVELGVQGEGDRVQVLKGVEAGDRVVTGAQFMLDSESRVREAVAKFRARAGGGGEEPAAPGEEGHR